VFSTFTGVGKDLLMSIGKFYRLEIIRYRNPKGEEIDL